jgi:hypothetical protein
MWYRGQANKEWELQPGVYRQSFPAKTEKDRLVLERRLTRDFRVESAGILARPANEAEIYFLQQHYRMPTRLLDWTGNPLAALYFAVKEHDSSDGAFFMMDAYGLGKTQKTGAAFHGVPTSRHPLFKGSMKRIHTWENSWHFPKFILPVRPDHFDKRMMLQKSHFTFHVPDHGTLTKAHNSSLKSFEIPASAKGELLHELFLLGVDEFSIFGDLDRLSKRLKDAHRIP